MTVSINGTSGLVFADGSTQGTAGYVPFRNRIINGDMRIDQRNAGANVTPADAAYTLDRWQYGASQASKIAIQQNKGSVTPPAGFRNYLGASVSATATIGASDYFQVIQPIEGYNVADLSWGTPSAAPVTLSFWVYASTTGTFGGCLGNSAFNRSYPFTYTISSAATWEYKTIKVPGETTGNWLTTNGAGLILRLGLGVGSTYSGTAGSWAAAGYISATGATSLMSSTSNYFYITGVQLEKGSTATPFEVRPYGTELALCQRYYQRDPVGSSYVAVTNITGVFPSHGFAVEMRTQPTVSPNQVSGTGVTVATCSTGFYQTGNSTLNTICAWTATAEL